MKYRDAISKEELCKIGSFSTYFKLAKKGIKKRMRKMAHEFSKYCPKSKSNNLIFCPKDIIKKKNDVKVQWINDYFKNFGKKNKNKKKGKKNKKKKKKTKKKT